MWARQGGSISGSLTDNRRSTLQRVAGVACSLPSREQGLGHSEGEVATKLCRGIMRP